MTTDFVPDEHYTYSRCSCEFCQTHEEGARWFIDPIASIQGSGAFSEEEAQYIVEALNNYHKRTEMSYVQWAVIGGLFGSALTFLAMVVVLP